MADSSRTIKVIFDGSVAGVVAAAATARRAISSVNDENSKAGKKFEEVGDKLTAFTGKFLKYSAIAGAGASAILTSASATSVLTTTLVALAPAALLLPGLLLGAGAAYGVFKFATEGVSKALSGNKKAYENLTPAAKSFVDVIRGLKPQIQELRSAVTEKFFDGFSTGLKQVTNNLFPVLTAQLPRIASGFNAIGLNALDAASTPFFKGALNSILANTGTAVHNLKDVVASALTGFVGLGTVGANYLPRIANAVDHVAERFKNWVTTGLETGSIQRFVDTAIATFKQLAELVKNVGSIIGEVFKGIGAGLGTSGLLDGILKTTAAVKEFFKSAQAQSALKSLGEVIRALADAFRGVLLEALKQISVVFVQLAPFLKEFAGSLGGTLVSALKIAGPLLATLATAMSDLPGPTTAVVIALIALGPAMKVFSILSGVVGFLGGLGGVLSTIGGFFVTIGEAIAAFIGVLGGFSGIAASIGGFFATIGGFFAGIGEAIAAVIGVLGGFGGILASIGAGIVAVITSPITIVIAIVAAIVGLFALAYNKITGFREFVDGVVSGIGSVFTTVFDAVVSFFANFGTNMSNIASSIGNFFAAIPGQIGDAISFGTSALFGFFGSIYDKISTIVGQIVGTLANIAVAGWTAFYNATVSVVSTVISFVSGIPATIFNALVAMATFLSNIATTAWNAFYQATSNVVSTVLAFITQIPGRVVAFLTPLISFVNTLATNAWNAFKSVTTNVLTAALSFIQQVPGKVGAFLGGLASQLNQIATNAWNAFKTATTNGINTVLTFFRNLVGQIVGALSGLAGRMLEIGRNIITGIINGITGAAGALFARIRQLAVDAFNAAKAAFGVQSPSIFAIPIGFGLGEGVGVGVTNSIDLIKQRIRDMASAAISTAKDSKLSDIFDILGGNSGISVTQSAIASIVPGVAEVGPIKPDLHTTLADAIKAAFAALPPVVNHLNLNTNDAALRDFIQLETDKIHREVARRVTAGAGVSFS